MRGIIATVVMVLLLPCSALADEWPAAKVQQPTATIAVNGDVLYWEGEEVVVKEIPGREVRLHVTAETKIEGVAGGRLKTGNKIAAQVSSDGHALSITLQIPDSGGNATPPGLRQ